MTYILTYHFAADYLTTRTPHRTNHFNYIKPYIHKGSLLIGGATEASPPQGILIFKDIPKEDIITFAKNDPYYKNGVAISYDIVKWNAVAGSLVERFN